MKTTSSISMLAITLALTACGGGGGPGVPGPTAPPVVTVPDPDWNIPDWNIDVDTTAPEITLAGSQYMSIAYGSLFNDPGFNVSDNVDADGLLADAVSIDGFVDTSTPGDYTLVYTVIDAAGNVSEITRIVTVLEPGEGSIATGATVLYEGDYEHALTIYLNEARPYRRTLDVSIGDGTLSEDQWDFELLTTSVEVPANALEVLVEVAIKEDSSHEGAETVVLNLSEEGEVVGSLSFIIDDTSLDPQVHNDLFHTYLSPKVTVVDDKLLVIGSMDIELYNLSNEVTLRESTNYGQDSLSYGDAVLHNGIHYVFGNGKLYTVDTDNLTLELLSESPWYLEWSSQIQVLNNEIYIVGGRDQNGDVSTRVMAYNIATKQWNRKSDLGQKRYGPAISVTNGKLYAFGGNYGRDTAEVYDPDYDSWSFVSGNEKLGARMDTSIVSGDNIYIIISNESDSSLVLIYNPLFDSYSEMVINLPSKYYQDSFLYRGRVYLVAGGGDGSTSSLVSFYIGDDQ